MGDIARRQGDLPEAQRLYQEAVDEFHRLGDLWGTARSSADLGHVLCQTRRPYCRGTLFEQALTAFVTLGHKRGIASVLEGFAYLAQCEQQYERALTLAGGAAAVRRASGAAPRPDEQAMFERTLEPAWRSLDPATAQATWTAGQRLSLDDAIELRIRSTADDHDSKLTGSRMRRTAATRSTGIPIIRPCSRIRISFVA